MTDLKKRLKWGNSAQLKKSDQQENFHFSWFWANYNPQEAIHSKHSRTKTTNIMGHGRSGTIRSTFMASLSARYFNYVLKAKTGQATNLSASLCNLKLCIIESLPGSFYSSSIYSCAKSTHFFNIGYFWPRRVKKWQTCVKCGQATALDWKCQVSTISFIMGWLWPQISVTQTMNGTYSQNICSYWTTTGIKQIQKDLYPLNEAWDNFICLSNFYVLNNFGSCNPVYGQILSHCTGTRNIICFSWFLGGTIWTNLG